jgi:hypothetical protein
MAKTPQKGSWFQRGLVWLFTLLFGLLAYWLLSFLVDDISHWPGPDYQALEAQMLDPQIKEKTQDIEKRAATLQREISTQQARQAILRDSTENAQTTMNQLLQFQRLSLEKNVKPTEQEQSALAESQQVFLSNQRQYQELTTQISQLQAQQRELNEEREIHGKQVEAARTPIVAEFQRLRRRHDLWIAATKLALLTPLLLLGIWLFFRFRESIYVPLFAAFAIAVAIQVMFVMHEYFPSRSFKYVLLATFLFVVTKSLLGVLRSIAKPSLESLHRQYREAYEAFLCPICSYPIRRGPLKFLYWTRRSIKKLKIPAATGPDAEAPYCCPACSTRLFDECGVCHHIRHSLLPSCEQCGATENSQRPVVLHSSAANRVE